MMNCLHRLSKKYPVHILTKPLSVKHSILDLLHVQLLAFLDSGDACHNAVHCACNNIATSSASKSPMPEYPVLHPPLWSFFACVLNVANMVLKMDAKQPRLNTNSHSVLCDCKPQPLKTGSRSLEPRSFTGQKIHTGHGPVHENNIMRPTCLTYS